MYGDVDQSDSDTSSDPEADIESPERTLAETTKAQPHAYIGSSDEEDACCLEDTGVYEQESSQHEKDQLFGAIEDDEEREKHYRNWCEKVDEIELGYG